VGIVGYGTCRFGAKFGFEDHPNVEVVAVSDLFPDRCAALAKACRCETASPSLDELLQDDRVEAVFLATDAPSHAEHCLQTLARGKHVAVAVPAVWGSLEDADRLLEAVRTSGLKYMMFETSSFRPDCYAMRQAYRAGALGRLVYSEGEYYHYHRKQIGSYRDWRVGMIPLWYPTHATAYYVGVTDRPFTSVSCVGFTGDVRDRQPDVNQYDNPFTDQIALFETAEGGASRMSMCHGIDGIYAERGRIYGERGVMEGPTYNGPTPAAELPKLARPPLPPGVAPGGHGGSHGHLTEEFVRAVLEDRTPLVHVAAALNMTVGGIVAHQSALKDGERLPVPGYAL
jgi:predicted dehydrogenase